MSMPEHYDSHTDVAVVKTHKANSVDHLNKRRPRPASAAVTRQPLLNLPVSQSASRRPASASRAPQRGSSLPPTPPMVTPSVLPQAPKGPKGVVPWDPEARLGRPRTPKETRQAIDSFFADLQQKHRQNSYKNITERVIDGELGPCAPMMGVRRYPYTNSMRLYQEEFSAMVCSTITHPFVTTSVNNAQSVPFDMLSGMAYDDARMSGLKTWHSEAEMSYQKKDLNASKNAFGVGLRSECVQFIN